MTRFLLVTTTLFLLVGCSSSPSFQGSTRGQRMQQAESSPTPVPGPAGVLGVAAALAWARKLRNQTGKLL